MNVRRALLTMAEQLDVHVPDLGQLNAVAGRNLVASVGPDKAGNVYEALTSLRLERRDGRLVVVADRQRHRKTGRYYTVDRVVAYLVDRVLGQLPPGSRVLDPSAGSGAFVKALTDRGVDAWGIDTDPEALELCRRRAPGARLIRGDALSGDVPGEFDGVVGNPPYIASGLRGARAIDPERQAFLKERYPEAAQYKLNTYPIFIQRALELVRTGGIVGYILPDSLLTGRYFTRLRRLLAEQTELLEVTLIREDFWPHGRVGQSILLIFRKQSPAPGHRVVVKVCDKLGEVSAAGTLIAQGELGRGPASRWSLVTCADDRELLGLVEACPARLGEVAESYSGLIGRNGQQSLLAGKEPGGGLVGRLLRSGREIDRYAVNWSGEHVRLDPHLIKSGGKLPYYRDPKLLLRQTADTVRAVFDDQGFFCLNNIHLLRPRRAGIDLHYILAVMNSRLIERYYRLIAMETGRLYAQVDLDLLEEVPLPPMEGPVTSRLSRLAHKRSKASAQEAVALEREINHLVERLYRSLVR